MANRYWVGGTGNWTTTSTTNWSASSGGASGASVPTAADSVFFDQAGPYTVSMGSGGGTLSCLDFTVSGASVTFAASASHNFFVYGSYTLAATTVWNQTWGISFQATTTGKTITTNSVNLNAVISFDGVGGGWTLGSQLQGVTGIYINSGTFDTSSSGNYNIYADQLISSGSAVRTINLNASTITLSNVTPFSITASANLTINAGTSQINLTSSGSPIIAPGGYTYYNIALTSTTLSNPTITGVNTFNNLTITGTTATGVTTVNFSANQTINGALTTTGTAGNRRVLFASDTYGIGRTLTCNGAASLTNADFRDIYVIGTAAPISGTRIGNRGNNSGITFSTPKTVYWNLAGSSSWWVNNGWCSSSGGTPSTDNFPLPQDTAIFDNSSAGTDITIPAVNPYISSVSFASRTTLFTFNITGSTTCYGSITCSSAISLGAAGTLTFSGGGTQTITSAGKTFGPITVDTYGGTVQLADALNIGANTLTVTNGTFTTAGYAVTADVLSSSNSNVRTINLNASTISLGSFFPWNTTATNLTFNAGTSTVNFTSSIPAISTGGLTFYNFAFTSSSIGGSGTSIFGTNIYNNLTIAGRTSVGVGDIQIGSNQTINGTLTINSFGSGATFRIFFRSDTIGTQRTLTVNSLSANDCDFRDIVIAGTAAGTSPTRAGDCGNNSGITFPAPKTVYWNLAGTQNWSATAWCTSSGGTPAVSNFPLAQDTAVFNNAGSITTVSVDAIWNIGTLDLSARTGAMTLSSSLADTPIYGDLKLGSGVTTTGSGNLAFFKFGTQTITSNGASLNLSVGPASPNTVLQLADAFTSSNGIYIANSGTFDSANFNVTISTFSIINVASVLKMGTSTWTITSAQLWSWDTSVTSSTIFAGQSNIVFSNNSTTARGFVAASGQYYNKITIGGSAISTFVIQGALVLGELASTKTTAHTITLYSSTTYNIGKWSVTGTVGNVVTVQPGTAATVYTLNIIGPANSGIDYLAVSYCAVSTTSPGEFYVGANSTNVLGNSGPIIFTATPSPRNLYWVGGTGNWSSTTKWATSSGAAGGAALPTSLDTVIFDSASNATAYTATIDAGVTMARCAAFTMAGPASGNVTFAGSIPIAFHGNVTFAATGITRSYSAAMNLVGNSSYTFTTNGLTLANPITVNGIGATWTLGSPLNIGSNTLTVTTGTFSTSASNHSITINSLSSSNSNVRTINLNGSTVNAASTSPVAFTNSINHTFNAGTSTIDCSNGFPTFQGGGLTYYNVSFTSTVTQPIITGTNTFNNLSITGRTTVGVNVLLINNVNQTINGTFTVSAGTTAACRTFIITGSIGRTITLTCAAVSLTDVDFRDITIAGAASPASGTRLGDCKGNSGITFPAAKTVYYGQTGSADWGATGSGSWSATSGGTLDATQFPLAQDTAVFPAATYPASGSTTTINAAYNIGIIDMSLRTSNTMTLATATNQIVIYGNWINGTGITISGTGAITFAGRTTQQITSSAKTFTQPITINSPSGSVTLQDALTTGTTVATTLTAGTLNLNNFTLTTGTFVSSGSNAKTITFGSGTIGLYSTGTVWNMGTVTINKGTGTILLGNTSTTARTFAGGGLSYPKLSIGGATGISTLTITGNNTFAEIASTKTVANTISLGTTTQTVGAWTVTGTAGNLLTITGTSAASPATLIYTGAGSVSGLDYLVPTFIRAYPLTGWNVGANSTNGGTQGWVFSSATAPTSNGNFFLMFN
jgi:hypothetical protein